MVVMDVVNMNFSVSGCSHIEGACQHYVLGGF